MTHYQVIARKYRPKTFAEVLGQDAIVTTLRNAIKQGRLGHAYLFCGSRGTGKTTLARVLAKALNCQEPIAGYEPCNACSSCKEIASGNSLDVLEIDGASHRGIDDIREINKTAGYTPALGKYKIFIIDEVHMLTKEAFNALLKTLEEPPSTAKFLFATTEPHKVIPTIVSRCQRFNLKRIPQELMISKLQNIAKDLQVEVEEEALRLLAVRSEGGMRDAESLFEQMIAFHEGAITTETVNSILGMMPRESFFELDLAAKEGRFSVAFEIVDRLFSEGKDAAYFVEGLLDHFRTHLLIKLLGKDKKQLSLSEKDLRRYQEISVQYTSEQCATVIDLLIELQQQKNGTISRVVLEATLLKIMRIYQKVSLTELIQRLALLEEKMIAQGPALPLPAISIPSVSKEPILENSPVKFNRVTEDPTPSQADLGKKKVASAIPKTEDVKVNPRQEGVEKKPSSHHDTLMHFASVELQGILQKKR